MLQAGMAASAVGFKASVDCMLIVVVPPDARVSRPSGLLNLKPGVNFKNSLPTARPFYVGNPVEICWRASLQPFSKA